MPDPNNVTTPVVALADGEGCCPTSLCFAGCAGGCGGFCYTSGGWTFFAAYGVADKGADWACESLGSAPVESE